MERKSIKEFSQFILSPDDKVALMNAKMERLEAQVKALADLAKAQESARWSKYPTC